MVERAVHWVDRVFPRVPVRQWVLTFPWPLRLRLARNHDSLKALHGIFSRAVRRWYCQRARALLGLRDARTGAVTALQRAGSDLSLNPHFHALFIDGVYAIDPETGQLRFYHLPAPTTEDIEALVADIARRCARWLVRNGLLDSDADLDEVEDPDDGLGPLQAASIARRVALGKRAGRVVRRYRILSGKKVDLPPRCAICDGFNLHAGVVVGAHNRQGLERVCRYIARGPLARSRLEQRPDGTLLLRLHREWTDGTKGIAFQPTELIEKLAALVPPPRTNAVIYTGILGARAAWRSDVVPEPEPEPETKSEPEIAPRASSFPRLVRPEGRSQTSTWVPWSYLLWRTFEVDGYECPNCGKKMRLRTVVIHTPATLDVLEGLTRSARAPPAVFCLPAGGATA